MRHTIEFKFGSFLPPPVVDAMKLQLGDLVPKEMIVQVKGQKAYTSMGRMVMVADYARGVITLMDPKGQRFATSPMADYVDKIAVIQKQRMPVMPPEVQQIFAKMRFDATTDRTGKTATIQGMGAEEYLLTISIEVPNPAGPAMQTRMEMHQWRAKAEEVNRIPALKELEVYAAMPKSGMDPLEMVTKSMAAFPGMADKIRSSLDEIMKSAGKGILRMQTGIYMSAMANLVEGAGGQPVVEYSMELAELSSAPVADSRFEVPAGYQSAPMEELVAVLFPAPKPAVPR